MIITLRFRASGWLFGKWTKICVSPLHKTDLKYPIFNLGGGEWSPIDWVSIFALSWSRQCYKNLEQAVQ